MSAPIMTRRHYRLLARALHTIVAAPGSGPVVEALIDALHRDNPRFDPVRFRAWVRQGDDGTARRFPG